MTKYKFIHPTKTGGTALEKYFEAHYFNYISGKGHANTCKDFNNPIIVVRCPIERFISMYNYWKNGSVDSQYNRGPKFIEKYGNYSIKNFIDLLKENKENDLYKGFTWNVHFASMQHWIKENDYSKTIVITYDTDLNNKIKTLLNQLNIPDKNIILKRINITKKEPVSLDETDMDFIKKRYAYDFRLWNNIHATPTMFMCVI